MLEILYNLISFHWILINSVLVLVVYQFIFRYWNYFSKQNVKFIRGLPFIGSHYKALFGIRSLPEDFQKLYEEFPNERIIGIYEVGGKPFYLIRDPELIKQITIKDFDHFSNHGFEIEPHTDPLLGRTLFFMKDQRWKNMRSTLSPAFTGSKMRLMFSLITDVTQNLCEFIREEIKNGNEIMELRELLSGASSDIIATCSFGINTNSIRDRTNQFYQTGKRISQIRLRSLLFMCAPKLMNLFRIRMFSEKDATFLKDIVKQNIDHRLKNNIVRNDMIDLLIQAQKGTLELSKTDQEDNDIGLATVEELDMGTSENIGEKWTDDDVTAQCMIFFLAGYLGITLLECFICHELALNPDIQQKLYQEIKEVKKVLNGKRITYPVLQQMKYLDMVVTETLRRWSIGANGERRTNKPYVVENYNGDKIQLNVGDSIWLPNIGIHMDPQYYPDPLKFDPERFSDENRSINMQTIYMPFGSGPRNCIGNRFALMVAKGVIFDLISNFYVKKCEKTDHPLKLKRFSTNLEAENGYWIRFKTRE